MIGWIAAGVFFVLFVIAAWPQRRMSYLPHCYGCNPTPEQQAMNSCHDCPVNDLCLRRPASPQNGFNKDQL